MALRIAVQTIRQQPVEHVVVTRQCVVHETHIVVEAVGDAALHFLITRAAKLASGKPVANTRAEGVQVEHQHQRTGFLSPAG